MSRYDGLIIPRSYSEYINKTDAATLLQALQLSGVMDNAPTANSNHPTKSSGVYTAISNITPVNAITNGQNKPPTSNAVYKYFEATGGINPGQWKTQKLGDHVLLATIKVKKDRDFINPYGGVYFSTGEVLTFPTNYTLLGIISAMAIRVSKGLGGVVIYNDDQYFTNTQLTFNVFNGKSETLNDDLVFFTMLFAI